MILDTFLRQLDGLLTLFVKNTVVFRHSILYFLVQLLICICKAVGVTALATEYPQGFAMYLRSSGQLSGYCTQNEKRMHLVSLRIFLCLW
jgi:hypothetical protein